MGETNDRRGADQNEIHGNGGHLPGSLTGNHREKRRKNEIYSRRCRDQMKTAQERQQPKSGRDCAEDRAQSIPRVGAANGRTFSGTRSRTRPGTHRRLRPGDQSTTAGKLNPKATAVGSMARALVTN